MELVSEKVFVEPNALNREAATWRNRTTSKIRLAAGWYARYERAGVLESTCCVAVSSFNEEEFHEFYKIPDDSDIEVVHNG